MASAATTAITVAVNYTNSAIAGIDSIAAGNTSVTIDLDNAYSESVENVLLYTTVNGVETSIVFSNVYATKKTTSELTSIASIGAENTATPVSHTYYNISGQQINGPQPGIVIIRTLMSDGTVSVRKIIVRK